MEIARLATWAMGSRFEVVVAGSDGRHLRAAGESALEEIEEQDLRLSLFRRDSLLSRINARAAARPVRLDPDLHDLLETCREVHAASEGAFDVTVAPLMREWGFHPRDAAATEAPLGMEGVHLDPADASVRFDRSGLALDLGAIGKGHALDLAADRLREAGIDRAFLHGGTSAVVAIGAPPGRTGWRVRIRSGTRAPDLVATLRDRSLCVSAPRGRTVERDGSTLGHVLDPRNRRPARGTATVAVLAPSARLADAWSTALLVLGRRPIGAPDRLTSAILAEGGTTWRIEGPESSEIETCRSREERVA